MNDAVLDAQKRARKQLKYGTRNLSARYYSELGEDDEKRGRRLFATKIAGYESSLKARGRSPDTVKSYKHGVLVFGAWLIEQGDAPNLLWDFDSINDEGRLSAYRQYLLSRFENRSTAQKRICAINSWLKWLGTQKKNVGKEIHTIAIPAVDVPDVFSLPVEEMRKMQQIAKAGKLTNEEAALFWMLLDSWQRITAIVSLRLRDIDFEQKSMTFRASTEKTRRNLVLVIQYDETLDALFRQIDETNPGRDPNGHIFCASRVAFGSGRDFKKYPILNSHIKRDRACEIVRSIARKSRCAKSTVRHLTPHVFRRFAVTQAMIAGALPSEIMSRSGHRDIATMLERYARPTPRSDLLSRSTYLLDADEKPQESRGEQISVSATSLDLAKAIESVLRNRSL